MARLEIAIAELIRFAGDDDTREGLRRTPARYLKAIKELCSGYDTDVDALLESKFSSSIDQAIVVPDIEFYSLCEHHLLPFFGTVHVSYIPRGKVLGLSKFARIVDAYARRLQMQETMTEQIGKALHAGLDPLSLGVLVKARHLCMCSRGVAKQSASFVTCYLEGAVRTDAAARAEFFALVGRNSHG